MPCNVVSEGSVRCPACSAVSPCELQQERRPLVVQPAVERGQLWVDVGWIDAFDGGEGKARAAVRAQAAVPTEGADRPRPELTELSAHLARRVHGRVDVDVVVGGMLGGSV